MNETLAQTPNAEQEAGRAELIRRLSDRDLLTSLIQQAVREAVLDHKRTGNPVAASLDGKVVIIQPEDIEVPEE